MRYVHSFAPASLTSVPVSTSRIRTSGAFRELPTYATRLPSRDGEGTRLGSTPLVMRTGAPVTSPVFGSSAARQMLLDRLLPTANAIRRLSCDAVGEKLRPAPTMRGTGSPATCWNDASNGRR